MAVSLALNWSPPPSSPLFDESTTPGGVSMNAESSQSTNLTSSPLTDSTNNMSNFTSNNGSSSGLSINSLSKQLQSAPYNGNLQAPASRSSSTSPQPMTYAAAASNPQRAGQYSMPSLPGPVMTSSVSKGEI